MNKILNNSRKVGIDTNIFIYFLNRNSSLYSDAVDFFKNIAQKEINLVTSVITLIELLSFDAPGQILERLEEELLSIPNMTIVEIDRTLSIEAARIRRQYRFSLPDSIQLATALLGKVDVFVTNDKNLTGFREIKVNLLI